MARVNYVKAYRGRRQCQHELADGSRCKLSPKASIHLAPTQTHAFDPGPPKMCGKCGRPIEIGDPYKFVKTKSSPYSSTRRERCDTCPTWAQSELTSSPYLSAIYLADETAPEVQISTEADDVAESLRELAKHYAAAAQECAEIRTEAADAIEDGFGHETYQSQELREQGETAENVASELECWEPDEFEEPDREDGISDDEWAEALERAIEDWAYDQQQTIESTWQEMG